MKELKRKKALERAERKAARKAEAAKKSTATEPAATTSGEVDCTLNSDVLNPLLDLPRQRENNQIRGSDEDLSFLDHLLEQTHLPERLAAYINQGLGIETQHLTLENVGTEVQGDTSATGAKSQSHGGASETTNKDINITNIVDQTTSDAAFQDFLSLLQAGTPMLQPDGDSEFSIPVLDTDIESPTEPSGSDAQENKDEPPPQGLSQNYQALREGQVEQTLAPEMSSHATSGLSRSETKSPEQHSKSASGEQQGKGEHSSVVTDEPGPNDETRLQRTQCLSALTSISEEPCAKSACEGQREELQTAGESESNSSVQKIVQKAQCLSPLKSQIPEICANSPQKHLESTHIVLDKSCSTVQNISSPDTNRSSVQDLPSSSVVGVPNVIPSQTTDLFQKDNQALTCVEVKGTCSMASSPVPHLGLERSDQTIPLSDCQEQKQCLTQDNPQKRPETSSSGVIGHVALGHQTVIEPSEDSVDVDVTGDGSNFEILRPENNSIGFGNFSKTSCENLTKACSDAKVEQSVLEADKTKDISERPTSESWRKFGSFFVVPEETSLSVFSLLEREAAVMLGQKFAQDNPTETESSRQERMTALSVREGNVGVTTTGSNKRKKVIPKKATAMYTNCLVSNKHIDGKKSDTVKSSSIKHTQKNSPDKLLRSPSKPKDSSGIRSSKTGSEKESLPNIATKSGHGVMESSLNCGNTGVEFTTVTCLAELVRPSASSSGTIAVSERDSPSVEVGTLKVNSTLPNENRVPTGKDLTERTESCSGDSSNHQTSEAPSHTPGQGLRNDDSSLPALNMEMVDRCLEETLAPLANEYKNKVSNSAPGSVLGTEQSMHSTGFQTVRHTGDSKTQENCLSEEAHNKIINQCGKCFDRFFNRQVTRPSSCPSFKSEVMTSFTSAPVNRSELQAEQPVTDMENEGSQSVVIPNSAQLVKQESPNSLNMFSSKSLPAFSKANKDLHSEGKEGTSDPCEAETRLSSENGETERKTVIAFHSEGSAFTPSHYQKPPTRRIALTGVSASVPSPLQDSPFSPLNSSAPTLFPMSPLAVQSPSTNSPGLVHSCATLGSPPRPRQSQADSNSPGKLRSVKTFSSNSLPASLNNEAWAKRDNVFRPVHASCTISTNSRGRHVVRERRVITFHSKESAFTPSHYQKRPSRRIAPTEVCANVLSPLQGSPMNSFSSPNEPLESRQSAISSHMIDATANMPCPDSTNVTIDEKDPCPPNTNDGNRGSVSRVETPTSSGEGTSRDSGRETGRHGKGETSGGKQGLSLPSFDSLNIQLPPSPSRRLPRRVALIQLSSGSNKGTSSTVAPTCSGQSWAKVSSPSLLLDESKIVSSSSDLSASQSEVQAFKLLKSFIASSYVRPQPQQEITSTNQGNSPDVDHSHHRKKRRKRYGTSATRESHKQAGSNNFISASEEQEVPNPVIPMSKTLGNLPEVMSLTGNQSDHSKTIREMARPGVGAQLENVDKVKDKAIEIKMRSHINDMSREKLMKPQGSLTCTDSPHSGSSLEGSKSFTVVGTVEFTPPSTNKLLPIDESICEGQSNSLQTKSSKSGDVGSSTIKSTHHRTNPAVPSSHGCNGQIFPTSTCSLVDSKKAFPACPTCYNNEEKLQNTSPSVSSLAISSSSSITSSSNPTLTSSITSSSIPTLTSSITSSISSPVAMPALTEGRNGSAPKRISLLSLPSEFTSSQTKQKPATSFEDNTCGVLTSPYFSRSLSQTESSCSEADGTSRKSPSTALPCTSKQKELVAKSKTRSRKLNFKKSGKLNMKRSDALSPILPDLSKLCGQEDMERLQKGLNNTNYEETRLQALSASLNCPFILPKSTIQVPRPVRISAAPLTVSQGQPSLLLQVQTTPVSVNQGQPSLLRQVTTTPVSVNQVQSSLLHQVQTTPLSVNQVQPSLSLQVQTTPLSVNQVQPSLSLQVPTTPLSVNQVQPPLSFPISNCFSSSQSLFKSIPQDPCVQTLTNSSVGLQSSTLSATIQSTINMTNPVDTIQTLAPMISNLTDISQVSIPGLGTQTSTVEPVSQAATPTRTIQTEAGFTVLRTPTSKASVAEANTHFQTIQQVNAMSADQPAAPSPQFQSVEHSPAIRSVRRLPPGQSLTETLNLQGPSHVIPLFQPLNAEMPESPTETPQCSPTSNPGSSIQTLQLPSSSNRAISTVTNQSSRTPAHKPTTPLDQFSPALTERPSALSYQSSQAPTLTPFNPTHRSPPSSNHETSMSDHGAADCDISPSDRDKPKGLVEELCGRAPARKVANRRKQKLELGEYDKTIRRRRAKPHDSNGKFACKANPVRKSKPRQKLGQESEGSSLQPSNCRQSPRTETKSKEVLVSDERLAALKDSNDSHILPLSLSNLNSVDERIQSQKCQLPDMSLDGRNPNQHIPGYTDGRDVKEVNISSDISGADVNPICTASAKTSQVKRKARQESMSEDIISADVDPLCMSSTKTSQPKRKGTQRSVSTDIIPADVDPSCRSAGKTSQTNRKEPQESVDNQHSSERERRYTTHIRTIRMSDSLEIDKIVVAADLGEFCQKVPLKLNLSFESRSFLSSPETPHLIIDLSDDEHQRHQALQSKNGLQPRGKGKLSLHKRQRSQTRRDRRLQEVDVIRKGETTPVKLTADGSSQVRPDGGLSVSSQVSSSKSKSAGRRQSGNSYTALCDQDSNEIKMHRKLDGSKCEYNTSLSSSSLHTLLTQGQSGSSQSLTTSRSRERIKEGKNSNSASPCKKRKCRHSESNDSQRPSRAAKSKVLEDSTLSDPVSSKSQEVPQKSRSKAKAKNDRSEPETKKENKQRKTRQCRGEKPKEAAACKVTKRQRKQKQGSEFPPPSIEVDESSSRAPCLREDYSSRERLSHTTESQDRQMELENAVAALEGCLATEDGERFLSPDRGVSSHRHQFYISPVKHLPLKKRHSFDFQPVTETCSNSAMVCPTNPNSQINSKPPSDGFQIFEIQSESHNNIQKKSSTKSATKGKALPPKQQKTEITKSTKELNSPKMDSGDTGRWPVPPQAQSTPNHQVQPPDGDARLHLGQQLHQSSPMSSPLAGQISLDATQPSTLNVSGTSISSVASNASQSDEVVKQSKIKALLKRLYPKK